MQYIKSIFLAAMLLLVTGNVLAQQLYLEPRLGLGTFRMKSMKEFQQLIISNSGVNAKATDSFGPYFQYGFNILTNLDERTRVGIFAEHGSTGGRIAYEDYSGELRYDMPVNYNALGATIYSHEPIRSGQLSFVAGIEASAFFSILKIESHGRIHNSTDSSSDKFNSLGVGIKPFVGLQYPVLAIPARLMLGYMANASGPFHVPGERERYLIRNSKNDKLEPGWSGFRLNLTVSVPLFK